MTPSSLEVARPQPLPPEFEALSDIVDRARKGEIVLDSPAPTLTAPGRLPAGWYDAPPVATGGAVASEWRAAAWGLACGLVVLIPGLLFMREAPLAPVRSPAPITASIPPLTPATFMSTVAAGDAAADVDTAEGLFAAGDVAAARAVLIKAAAADSPRALFLLAETYDPNLLAARGSRGATADAVQARALYAAAATLGHPLAAARIRALQ